MAKMIKLHVTDGMIDPTNGTWIADSTLNPRFPASVGWKITTMDASKTDLVELDWLLSPGRRLCELYGSRCKDFDLLSDENVKRV